MLRDSRTVTMNKIAYLTPLNASLIIGTIVALSIGQVLFKSASGSLIISQPLTLISPQLLLALSIYGIATLAWIVVLSRVPLSFAFPFYGLAFLLVPLLAKLLLHEPLRWQALVGGFVILVGIWISAKGD